MSRDPIWSSSLPKKEIFSLRPEGQGGVNKEGQRVLQVKKAFRSKFWMLEKACQRTEGILAWRGNERKTDQVRLAVSAGARSWKAL